MGENDRFVYIVKANGSIEHRIECTVCGTCPTDAVSKKRGEVAYLTKRYGEPTETKSWDEKFRQKANLPPCAVNGCDERYVELHHFAPRAVFGHREADDWPTAYLCVRHHHYWHSQMEGYVWQRRSQTPTAAPPPKRQLTMKEIELRDEEIDFWNQACSDDFQEAA